MDQYREFVIYLAYAPADLPYDREMLGNYIRQQNDIARTGCNPVFLRMVECEDLPRVPPETGLVLSLSVRHGGGGSVLRDLWERPDSPAIMTYFRQPERDAPAQPSYTDLQAWLESRGHYWADYTDVTTVMYKLLVYLQKQGIGLSFTEDAGGVHLNGETILPVEDFDFLKNSGDLQELNRQICQLDEELKQLYESHDYGSCRQLNARRQELARQKLGIIRSYYAHLRETEDVTSDRLRRARSAMERGDLQTAQQILNREEICAHADQIKENCEVAVAKALAEARQELKTRLKEYLELANLLQLQPQTPERIARVRQVLTDAALLEQRESLGDQAQFACAEYLLLWAEPEEAAQFAGELAGRLSADGISADHARAEHLYAKACARDPRLADQGIALYSKALSLWNDLRMQDHDRWFRDWAACVEDSAAAALHHSVSQFSAAKALLEESIAIANNMPDEERNAVRRTRIRLFLTLGDLFKNAGDILQAECRYTVAQALSMDPSGDPDDPDGKIQPATDDPGDRLLLTSALLRMGQTMLLKMKPDAAYGFLEDALTQIKTLEAMPTLSATLTLQRQELSYLCRMYFGQCVSGWDPEQAEILLKEALEMVNAKTLITLRDRGQYAVICGLLAGFYADGGKVELAREYMDMAEAIFCRLQDEDLGSTLYERIRILRMVADAYLLALDISGCADDNTDSNSFNNRLRANARDYLGRALELHRQLETADFQPTLETWSLFANSMSMVKGQDKAGKELVRRVGKFCRVSDPSRSQHQCRCLLEYARFCHSKEKKQDARKIYMTELEKYRQYLSGDDDYNLCNYARYVQEYSRLLHLSFNNRKDAIAVLEQGLDHIGREPRTMQQLTAAIRVCDELMRLHQKQPGSREWERYRDMATKYARAVIIGYRR